MEQQVADYTLTLQESDGDSEQITGSEISLKYVPGDDSYRAGKEAEQVSLDYISVGEAGD